MNGHVIFWLCLSYLLGVHCAVSSVEDILYTGCTVFSVEPLQEGKRGKVGVDKIIDAEQLLVDQHLAMYKGKQDGLRERER